MNDETDPPRVAPLLAACGLRRRYVARAGRAAVIALDGIDLELRASEALGVVGPSGAGKSTLGRCLALLEGLDEGVLVMRGRNLRGLSGAKRRQARRRIQLVFQDSARALNPRWPASELVIEALRIDGSATKAEWQRKALELMDSVGLAASLADRQPRDLSGGQRQRVAIARALACQPEVLILDEATAGLDPSVAAQTVNLMEDLRSRLDLALLWISHDLALMAHVADRIVVLEQGRIVESGAASTLTRSPQHALTQALVAESERSL
jgi:ABC-type glutathione transport system ATPase component